MYFHKKDKNQTLFRAFGKAKDFFYPEANMPRSILPKASFQGDLPRKGISKSFSY